mmetsp:Transcript_27606/g.60407  ORF Transcript_27606/g.60407 Transcript_27606/m.60407 type:complete len:217 (+) Transcript_27606:583-1233(+)
MLPGLYWHLMQGTRASNACCHTEASSCMPTWPQLVHAAHSLHPPAHSRRLHRPEEHGGVGCEPGRLQRLCQVSIRPCREGGTKLVGGRGCGLALVLGQLGAVGVQVLAYCRNGVGVLQFDDVGLGPVLALDLQRCNLLLWRLSRHRRQGRRSIEGCRSGGGCSRWGKSCSSRAYAAAHTSLPRGRRQHGAHMVALRGGEQCIHRGAHQGHRGLGSS